MLRDADDGGLPDEGGGPALAVDDDEGAGAGVVGAAECFGERGVGADGDRAAGEGAGAQLGRCSRRRAMRRLLPAPVQMIAARMAARSASIRVSMPLTWSLG